MNFFFDADEDVQIASVVTALMMVFGGLGIGWILKEIMTYYGIPNDGSMVSQGSIGSVVIICWVLLSLVAFFKMVKMLKEEKTREKTVKG